MVGLFHRTDGGNWDDCMEQDAVANAVWTAECAIWSVIPIVGAFPVCDVIEDTIGTAANCGLTEEERFMSALSKDLKDGQKSIMNKLTSQSLLLEENSFKLDQNKVIALWSKSIGDLKYLRSLFGKLDSLPNSPGSIDVNRDSRDFKHHALLIGKELFQINEMINGGNLFRPESIYEGSMKHKDNWCKMRKYFEDLLINGYTMYFVGLAMDREPIDQEKKDELKKTLANNNYNYHRFCEEGDTPRIYCKKGEEKSTGVISHETCWHQKDIHDTDSKSKLVIMYPGRYFVSVSSYIKSYKNKKTTIQIIQNWKGEEDILFRFGRSYHKADMAGGYTGASRMNLHRIAWFNRGDHMRVNVTSNENGEIEIVTTLFKLLSSTYLDCMSSNANSGTGTVSFDQYCGSSGIDNQSDKYFKIKQTGGYFVCLSANIDNYSGQYASVSLEKKNEDFTLFYTRSQHQGDEKASNKYSGGGVVTRCTIENLHSGQELKVMSNAPGDNDASGVHISMTRLYKDSKNNDFVSCGGTRVATSCRQCTAGGKSHHWCKGDCEWKNEECREISGEIPWFAASKTTDDGTVGLVTFDFTEGYNGAVEEYHKQNFKIMVPGYYYVGLSAFIETYEGGHFCVAVEDTGDNFMHVCSDHADDKEGFDGSGSYHSDRIRYFSKGDMVKVRITTAEKESKLSSADLSLFRLA